MIVVKNKELQMKVRDNGGYCLCAIIHNKESKCMCKEFKEDGICRCGVYEKCENCLIPVTV